MKIFSNFSTKKHIRGFTLIELMVSMAIFIFVITVATGSLFSAQAVNTKLEQTQLILDGVNLAAEVMARDMRYGEIFNCVAFLPNTIPHAPDSRNSCPYGGGGYEAVIFKPSVSISGSTDFSSDRIAYYLLD